MAAEPNNAPRNPALRKTLLGVLIAVVSLSLICCAGIGWLIYRHFDNSPKNPSEVISQYYMALKNNDADTLASTICSDSRSEARNLIKDFNTEFEKDAVELVDIRWINDRNSRTSDGETIIYARVTYEVNKGENTFARNAKVKFTVRDKRICSAEEE